MRFAACLRPGSVMLMLGVWGVLGLMALVGCAGPERAEDTDAAAREARAADDEGGQRSLTDSAEAAARQLEAAMARTQPGLGDDPGGRIEWRETWPDRSRAQGDGDGGGDRSSGAGAAASEADETQANEGAGGDGASEPAAPQPRELLEMLLAHVHDSNEPAMRRALSAATLRAAVGDATLDQHILQPLGHTQRRTVERYHRMVLATMQQLGASSARLDRAALLERLDALFEHEPIEIRKLALCREVSGYGIYEAFERHVFLAGQRQRLILYLELDHFHAHRTDDDRYEVKLQQQVVLYNESDGLAVWRQDPVQITDVSRNRRRDFFVVQLITLPQRLNVGNYRLKVRITDQHGGSVDETTTRLQLVADEKLLAGNGSD